MLIGAFLQILFRNKNRPERVPLSVDTFDNVSGSKCLPLCQVFSFFAILITFCTMLCRENIGRGSFPDEAGRIMSLRTSLY
jgi:hypothetical protein